MDCPECGTPLVTYRLDGREAPVCEQCGHVGIDAEHRGSRRRVESWSDALSRYYGDSDGTDELTIPVHAGPNRQARAVRVETWAEALRRFYAGAARPTDAVGDVGDSTDGDSDGNSDNGDSNSNSDNGDSNSNSDNGDNSDTSDTTPDSA